MLFMLLGRDRPDSLHRRATVRPAHLARIKTLADAGRIIVAGPLPASDRADETTVTGSLIIAEFESQAAARAWFESDPYMMEGVFESVTVEPFRQVLP